MRRPKFRFFSSQEPFRLLIPMGLAAGLSGVSLWIFNLLKSHDEPVSLPHAQLMTGAFLYCFVAGYLLSFLPRLTSTRPVQPRETVLTAFFALATGISALAGEPKISYLMAFLGLSWLLWFYRSRAYRSRRKLPTSYLFLGLGLFLGWLGAFVLSLPVSALPSDPVLLLARRLHFQAMFLFLVMAEGSRVLPLLCGRSKHTKPTWVETILISFVILAGFGFEYLDHLILGGFLKAAAPTWVAARYWGLFSPLTVTSKLAMGLLISAPLMLAGLWMAWLLPGDATEWMHLSYVGGFTLMSLMIATRLSLSDGSYDLSLESNTPGVTLILGLVGLATFFRVLAPIFATQGAAFLAVASVFWIAAVVMWSWQHLGNMIEPQVSTTASQKIK